jgi:hypothetical protein
MLLYILCVGITASVSAIDEFAGAQSPSFSVITPKTVAVSCPAPCECMMASDADARWGSGNYVSCSNTPCGEVVVSSEMRVPKFCYKMSPPVVGITTPVPYQIQQPAQVIPAKQVIPVQPGSQDIVPARNIQQKGVVPAQVNPQNPLPPDDQGQGKDGSGLSAGSLGKTGSVQPGFIELFIGFFANILTPSTVAKPSDSGSCGLKAQCQNPESKNNFCTDLNTDDHNCGACGNTEKLFINTCVIDNDCSIDNR